MEDIRKIQPNQALLLAAIKDSVEKAKTFAEGLAN